MDDEELESRTWSKLLHLIPGIGTMTLKVADEATYLRKKTFSCLSCSRISEYRRSGEYRRSSSRPYAIFYGPHSAFFPGIL